MGENPPKETPKTHKIQYFTRVKLTFHLALVIFPNLKACLGGNIVVT